MMMSALAMVQLLKLLAETDLFNGGALMCTIGAVADVGRAFVSKLLFDSWICRQMAKTESLHWSNFQTVRFILRTQFGALSSASRTRYRVCQWINYRFRA
jgi:hypothetical protein